MWDSIITILFMTVVGSIIAGSTNHLAIQMLFRPYEAKYIGKWRVPFTPGLIPRRRDGLSIQLGSTVEEYLMTPEMLRKKLITEKAEEQLQNAIYNYLNENVLSKDETIKEYLIKFNQYGKIKDFELKIDDIIDIKVKEFKNVLESKKLKELLGESGYALVNSRIPKISGFILIKGIEFIGSDEGDKLIKNMVDDFLTSKGKLGGVVNLLVGDSKGVKDKIKRELINILKSPKAFDGLNNLLENEIANLSERELKEFIGNIDEEPIIKLIKEIVKKELDIDNRLDKTIHFYIPDIDSKLKDVIIPNIVKKAMVLLDSKIETLLNHVDIKTIVKEQVDTFPTEKLENLLLGVSKREFKMITYLGFFLGAIIGFVQGLISLML